MYSYEMTAVGMEHEHQGKACQDFVTTFRWNGVAAQVCVDGASAAENRCLGEAMAQFVAMYFHSLLGMTDDQLARQVLGVIRSAQAGWEELQGCTLVASAMDLRSFRHLGVSLGDGILLAREGYSGQVITLLPPQRRADGSACSTCESDEQILCHVRTVRGRAKDALLASTNGLENTLWDVTGGTLSPTLGKLMQWVVEDPAGARRDFAELVYDLSLHDDAGVAVMVNRPAIMGDWEGRKPDRFCHRRRDARRCLRYLRWRDAGYSRAVAAQRAGWDERTGAERIRYMQAIGAD